MTHHRVELVEGSNNSLDCFNALALSLCKSFNVGFLGGNELMKRRIKEADGNRAAFKGFIELFKVSLLHREDLVKSGFSFLNGV